MGNANEVKARDGDTEEIIRFFNMWFDRFLYRPVTSRDVIERAYGDIPNPIIRSMVKNNGDPHLRDAFPHSLHAVLSKEKEFDDKARALGNWLKSYKERPYGGYCLKYKTDRGHRKPALWRLESTSTKK
jgi:hypothetical protein